MKHIILLSLFSSFAFSQIVIMVASKNKLIKVSKKELTDIYLKKSSKIQGISVIPLDNRQNYEEFCKKIMNKTPRQMRAYWARQLYRGTKTPPRITSNAQIKLALKKNVKTISYASHKLTGKIVFRISK